MSPVATAALSIGTLLLGWLLSEITHRRRALDDDRRQLARQHISQQTALLVELQREAIEYTMIARRYLYAAWAMRQDPDNDEQSAEWDQLGVELEEHTTTLFAARAMVDDLRIRSVTDHLEEMARQFCDMPGRQYEAGGTTSEGEKVLWEQDDSLQGILWRLNNFIGSRQLELVGVVDPETPPYRGE